MNAIPSRIFIYSKDVMNITGRGDRAARKLLQRIRRHYNKDKGNLITVEEFCRFTGCKEENVRGFLK